MMQHAAERRTASVARKGINIVSSFNLRDWAKMLMNIFSE
jgi:hypothetical protein